MRSTVLLALSALAALPLAAQQSQQKILYITGDTIVSIERGATNSCTVKVDDRTLPARQADPICERQKRVVMLDGFPRGTLAASLDSVRVQLRSLNDSALQIQGRAALQLRESQLAQELASRSLALSRYAGDRSESRVFGSLARAAQQGSLIGVSIDPRPRDTDRWGAYVAAVTPNYPAEKAGIRVGDIITRINGQSIASGQTERAATEDESLPWLRLSEIVRALEPGKAVDLEYRRNNRNETTRITPVEDNRWFASTTAPSGKIAWAFGRSDDDVPTLEGLMTAPNGTNRSVAPTILLREPSVFSANGLIANLELAPINPKLGSYFGTERGVLVLSAPTERNLGLESGDVVTAVDGRSVDTPAELIRVLRTYDKNKQFTLQVTRQKQRQTITTTLP